MKLSRPLIILAAALIAGPSLYAVPSLSLPYKEDFAAGPEYQDGDPIIGTLDYHGFTYSVDGTGAIGLFDASEFLNIPLSNFSNLAVIGGWEWLGGSSQDIHNFTVTSDNATPFALTSLDWATGSGGPPTLYTISGYRGGSLVAQATDVDITTGGTFAASTGNAITGTIIGPDPSEEAGYGLHLSFIGINWGNIDQFVFSAPGNDILVALDNIQYSPAIPEPSSIALLAGAGALALAARYRRTK